MVFTTWHYLRIRMIKPIYIFAPYWMGDFSPSRLGLAHHNWRLLMPELPDGSPTERMGVLCRALADEVAAIRADGNLPIAFVGDCTFSIGMLAGLQQEFSDLALVWYDAHGDFNTHTTTPSGFIGGMPLAMLCGRGEQTIVEEAGAKIQPETDVILTDARDLDPQEAEAVAQSKLTHLPDVFALSSLPLPNKPLYVHFDSDVLSTTDLSAVSYPAGGGPSLEIIDASLTHLATAGQLAALSITLWNPDLDKDGTAEQVVLGVIERLLDQLS